MERAKTESPLIQFPFAYVPAVIVGGTAEGGNVLLVSIYTGKIYDRHEQERVTNISEDAAGSGAKREPCSVELSGLGSGN